MKRRSILLMLIGFSCIFLSSASGAFLSTELTKAFIFDPSQLEGWRITLLKSAHGHFNLIGMTTILVSLTTPYSQLTERLDRLRFWGMIFGCLAAGPGLFVHAFSQASVDFTLSSSALGFGFSMFLLALWLHIYGLLRKLKVQA